jgi:hypothetical protein
MTGPQYEIARAAYEAFHSNNPPMAFDQIQPESRRVWYRVAQAVVRQISGPLQNVPFISTRGERVDTREHVQDVIARYL